MVFHDQIPDAIVSKYGTLGRQLVEFAVVAIVLYVIGRFVVEPAVRWLLRKTKFNRTVTQAIEKVVHVIILVFAVTSGAGVAGFKNALTGSALIVAVLTLAVGLAAQDVLSNFVSGVFIVQDPKLNVGDTIEWGDKSGVIRDIGFRVTRVRTANNESILIPNTELTTTSVTNKTTNDPMGISYKFGIGYDDDVAETTEIIMDVADENDVILDDPSPTVRVTDLADTSVILTGRVWISKRNRDKRIDTRSAFIRRVNERCRDAGIDLSTTSQHDLSGEIGVNKATQS